jgi:hypothetical protein
LLLATATQGQRYHFHLSFNWNDVTGKIKNWRRRTLRKLCQGGKCKRSLGYNISTDICIPAQNAAMLIIGNLTKEKKDTMQGLKKIVRLLHAESRTLSSEKQQLSERMNHIGERMNHISSALEALNGTTNGATRHLLVAPVSQDPVARDPRKGRKLSAAHVRAIKRGLARARAAQR